MLDMSPAQFESHWSKIAPAWEPKDDAANLLVNRRSMIEREKKHALVQKRRESGSKGGRKSAQAKAEQTGSNCSSSSSTQPQSQPQKRLAQSGHPFSLSSQNRVPKPSVPRPGPEPDPVEDWIGEPDPPASRDPAPVIADLACRRSMAHG